MKIQVTPKYWRVPSRTILKSNDQVICVELKDGHYLAEAVLSLEFDRTIATHRLVRDPVWVGTDPVNGHWEIEIQKHEDGDELFVSRGVIEYEKYRAENSNVRCLLDEIMFYEGYSKAEKGYPDKNVATGNWNTFRDRKNQKEYDTMPVVGEVLTALGFECEWCDEWMDCTICNRAVRSSPDSYGWVPRYVVVNYDTICTSCLLEDESLVRDYIDEIENDHTKIVQDSDVLAAIKREGFESIEGAEYENGLYGGQADDPRMIAHDLRNRGVTRFIFALTDKGQFDISFTVLVHKDEIGLLKGSIPQGKGIDPAEVLRKGLANASIKQAQLDKSGEPGVRYVSIDPKTGEAHGRIIPPEDFIEKGINP